METSSLLQLSQEFQALSGADGLAIITLAILEGILSVDNSLVLAIMVRTLPKELQKKALMYGIFGAFFFRVVALIFAAHLMRFMAFKIIGGGYLVYLAMKHMFFFYKEDAHQPRPKAAASFWRTVLLVELTDIAFSIDSITTAVAMSDKLIVVWLAGIMGIIFLRFAAGFFIRLLEKLPKLEDLAYQLIFFVGTKLLLEGFHIEISHAVFWMMMAVIAVLGSALVYRDYYQTRTESHYHNRLLTQLKAHEITVDEILALEY
ncbi:MAG: TerC family protein, partial [Deltaproteobacteria bacterium]|nr:TerC family protein [Deltaproteobacteria bacterium]